MSISWTDARKFKNNLYDDGWRSPDTYDNAFLSPIDGSAVYLFLAHNEMFDRAFVAYVGMSTNLVQRFSGHSIYRELCQSPYWPQRLFKPMDECALRDAERDLIQELDPPWNIACRKRGVEFQ